MQTTTIVDRKTALLTAIILPSLAVQISCVDRREKVRHVSDTPHDSQRAFLLLLLLLSFDTCRAAAKLYTHNRKGAAVSQLAVSINHSCVVLIMGKQAAAATSQNNGRSWQRAYVGSERKILLVLAQNDSDEVSQLRFLKLVVC